METRYYTADHTDNDVIKKSSSGGAFTAITDGWFDTHRGNAVVYGAAWAENLQVKHIRATGKAGRDLMRGSKYIKSSMAGVYSQVAEDISAGRAVLFSGTPCQISAEKNYLEKRNLPLAGLLTVEVLCRGTGDTGYFSDYIKELEKNTNQRLCPAVSGQKAGRANCKIWRWPFKTAGCLPHPPPVMTASIQPI